MDILIIIILIGWFIWLSIFISILFRVVVPNNEVHIVQKKKADISYGKWKEAGNVYYNFPSWLPIIGIERVILPVSIFWIELTNYEAYDSDKVPFTVDVMAFFKIDNSWIAAQRILSFEELKEQLKNILQWSIRRVLAQRNLFDILEWRAEFSVLFTTEVNKQLEDWWVTTTQNVELMNIQDSDWEQVVQNIMDMKKSEIEKNSRMIVAENRQKAETKEIEAQREIDISRQQADRVVWEKTAEKEKLIGIANEKSKQEVAIEQKITTERNMDVLKVESVKKADIDKEVAIVKAWEDKATEVIKAEATQQQTIIIADWQLQAQRKEAEGIKAVWLAEADAKKQMELAPVYAQIELAKEIGSNDNYMNYLLWLEGIKAGEVVWVEKAKALAEGDLKILSTTGNWVWSVDDWLNSLMDVFSWKGWMNVWSFLEVLNNTEVWKELLDKLLKRNNNIDLSKKELKKKKEKKEIDINKVNSTKEKQEPKINITTSM